MDTISHEYVHYVITRKWGKQIPLWLHEGLAKYLEARWRNAKYKDKQDYLSPSFKKLLAEAGYAKGLKTTILALAATSQDAAAAVQAYLGAVGIDAKLDLADMGRFYGSVFGKGYWRRSSDTHRPPARQHERPAALHGNGTG